MDDEDKDLDAFGYDRNADRLQEEYQAGYAKGWEDAAVPADLLKALDDLSFACFGGLGTCAPDTATYNRTFEVLQKYRNIAAGKS